MKKLITAFSFVTLLFTSCTGPEGPPGADGLLAQVFEVEVDFTAADNYEFLVGFPANIEVFESDVVVAYILDEVDGSVDIWEPLPQSLFIGGEILLYGYDYTRFDVNFFIDGTIDPAGLDPIYRDGVIFRVAIIPAAFAKTIDLNNINEVMAVAQTENIIRVAK